MADCRRTPAPVLGGYAALGTIAFVAIEYKQLKTQASRNHPSLQNGSWHNGHHSMQIRPRACSALCWGLHKRTSNLLRYASLRIESCSLLQAQREHAIKKEARPTQLLFYRCWSKVQAQGCRRSDNVRPLPIPATPCGACTDAPKVNC